MPAININAYIAKDRDVGWTNGCAITLLNFDIFLCNIVTLSYINACLGGSVG